ncbi:MAG TPA: hypothetical protein VGX25_04995 [Actinophytocola sp.]|uniref:hypothetical protein n=1 Tax=Actinophytocola sp. TaxID=1872138 RepID=UPI002DDCF08A|nr:hypothetical protein [Actinophytocola sp.]HEV2778738.1 hypothetical protein [Actinophytocola sp.]
MQIILLRHAQKLSYVDELAHCRIPDSLRLTELGRRQARAAPVLRAVLSTSSPTPPTRTPRRSSRTA